MADEETKLIGDDKSALVLRTNEGSQILFELDAPNVSPSYLRFFREDKQEIAAINMRTGEVRTTIAATDAGVEAAQLFWEAFGQDICRHFKQSQP